MVLGKKVAIFYWEWGRNLAPRDGQKRPCTLQTSNSFARSDTGVVIDSEPHLSGTCKTSLLSAPLAVHVHTGCSAFQFYIPTKP